ncbi:MAG: hypothetical protein ACYCWE_19765 [Eubacteriales bacterium]
MFNHFHRVFSLFMLTAILICVFLVSCAESSDTLAANTTASDDSGIVTQKEELMFEADSLPADLSFSGQIVTVLYREEEADEFFMDTQTGDVVDDAVYTSNRSVMERLNIEMDIVKKKGNVDTDRTAFINYVHDTVMTGDNAFQIVAGLTYNMPAFVQKGLLKNLREVPHIEFSKPWWAQGLIEYGTIGDKLFFASGDISLSLIKKIFCLYFNINLLDSLGMDSPYTLVHAGTWTKDVYSEMAVTAYSDLNGNGSADLEDQYGFALYDRNHCNTFIGGFDLQVTDKDENGNPILVFGNERAAEAVTWLCGFFHNNNGIYYNKNSDAGTDLSIHQSLGNMFTSNRLLFISAEFNNAEIYRDMSYEYGVLPPPKWDEAQEGYFTLARNVYSSFGIPVTVQDTELIGALMEAVASENYRTLAPVYFETALKVKYSRNEESSRMFDIIKNGMKFNLGYTYHQIVGMTDHFVDCIRDNNTNWASVYATKEKTALANIEKFMTEIEEIK